METSLLLACAGASISMIGVVRYIRGILRDGTKPRLASWLAWLASWVVFMIIGLLQQDYGAAAFAGIGAVGNVGVLAAAWHKKAAHLPSGRTDWTCLILACACLAAMFAFPEAPLISAALAVAANLIATWPTLVHAYAEPHAETWQLFAANAGAGLAGCAGVIFAGNPQVSTLAGPAVSLFGNTTLTLVTLIRRRFSTLSSEICDEIELVKEAIEGSAPQLTEE